jgi:hypothetical protein
MSEDSKLLQEHQEHLQKHLQIFSSMTRNKNVGSTCSSNLKLILRVVSSQEFQFLVNTKRTVMMCFERATNTSIYILKKLRDDEIYSMWNKKVDS